MYCCAARRTSHSSTGPGLACHRVTLYTVYDQMDLGTSGHMHNWEGSASTVKASMQ